MDYIELFKYGFFRSTCHALSNKKGFSFSWLICEAERCFFPKTFATLIMIPLVPYYKMALGNVRTYFQNNYVRDFCAYSPLHVV